MTHVVFFSGGIASWGTAERVKESLGEADELILLFTDTLIEDPDLYRFLKETAADLGGELVWLTEGRDPWQVFFDVRLLGNTRADPCSRILKRELSRKWVEENCTPEDTTLYVGIDWTEMHRCEAIERNWKPYTVRFPLCDSPWLTRLDLIEVLRRRGIEPPALYAHGFPHNNCGGFCIKAGQGQFKMLLEGGPHLYAYHEAKEQEFREFIGKDVSILRDRTGGDTQPLTMKAFRERIEAGLLEQCDLLEWGGCGCFTDYEDEPPQAALATPEPEGEDNGDG